MAGFIASYRISQYWRHMLMFIK